MTQITYSFVGVNTGQLASSINNLRRSSTYRQIEVDASTRYSHVVVVMGPNINPLNETGLHRLPAVSGRNARDPGTLYVFLDTTTSAARSTPSGELALTVDQLIAHEMAHATFPPRPIGGDVFGGRPSEQLGAEEDSVIRLSDAVSADLGIIGNTGSPQYKDNPGPLSTFGDSYAANPLILKFGDGTRANVGYGPLDGAPTVGGTIYGFKRLEVSGDTATQRGTAQETHSEEQNVSDGWQRSVLPSILGMDTTLGTMGGFTGTVFDSGNNQPRSQQTSTFNIDSVPQLQRDVFDAGRELVKYYATHNASALSAGDGNGTGSWSSSPSSNSSDTPVLRALEKFRRSAAPDGPAPTSVQGATPAFQPDAVYSPDGNFIGNFPTSSAATPSAAAFSVPGPGYGSWITGELSAAGKRAVPVLTRVGKYVGDGLIAPAEGAFPSGPLLQGPTAPDLQSEETQRSISDKPARYLGRRTYSQSQGPASDTRLPAVPFLSNEVLSPDDRASFSDRFGNWTSSPEDFTLQNPNLLVPAPEPDGPLGIFSGKPMSLSRLPSSVWGLPDTSDSSGDGNWFNFLAGLAFQNPTQPAPPPQTGNKPMRSLGRRIVNQPPASIGDTRAPAAPLAPSDDPNFSGGLLGGLAALAGIDPQNPNQPAPPPDDEREQADMRALDARLSSSGTIKDAVALYNARKSSRR